MTGGGAGSTGATSACYSIASAAAGDAGEYCVTVAGACGAPAVQCATLTVNQNVAATDPDNAEVCAGQPVQFCTVASGTGPFTYVWRHDGVVIPGATGDCYSIASAAAGDAGEYCVTVSGACGTPAVQCATLTVDEAPSATAMDNLTRCPGTAAEFCTVASGTGPFTYA